MGEAAKLLSPLVQSSLIKTSVADLVRTHGTAECQVEQGLEV